MELSHSIDGGVLVISVNVSRLDCSNAEEFETTVKAILQTAASTQVVMDLAGVEFLDSTSISALQTLNGQLCENDGMLRLAGMTDRLRDMLVLLNMDRLLGIFDTTEQAVAAYRELP